MNSAYIRMQSLEQIKTAVDKGLTVYWSSDIYEVEYWEVSKKYVVICTANQFATGLCDGDVSGCYLSGGVS